VASRRLILKHNRALGDSILLSALVRDIHLARPGYFDICVDANFSPVWHRNPLATLIKDSKPPSSTLPVTFVQISYKDGIRATNNNRAKSHMLSWFHRDFMTQTGMALHVTAPKGDLYLSDEEKQYRPTAAAYWVLVAGYKKDITVKHWPDSYWQALVDRMTACSLVCVQAGAVRRRAHST
jgi:ADP-heptose:LPS heptosyltransferase